MAKRTAKNKTSHGGARPGSGRKKTLPDGSTRISVVLTPENLAWLDSQDGTRSDVIRSVLEYAAKRTK